MVGNLQAGEDLRLWCMALEVLAMSSEEKQRSPPELLRIMGRGQRISYKEVDRVHSRRAPKCGCHITVAAGYNSNARVAATFAALANKLQMAPQCWAFQSALLNLLDEERDSVLQIFWQELGIAAGVKFRCAVVKAAIAAQEGRAEPASRILCSLTAGVERKLTKASLKEGSANWRQ